MQSTGGRLLGRLLKLGKL